MSHSEEAAVRAVIGARIAALHDRDPAAANAALAEDVVAFELVPPLALAPGAARDEAATAAWFAGFTGPIEVEVRDLTVAAGGNVAFAHALHGLSATRANGSAVHYWLRSTFCFRKRGGVWRIVHSHSSVPIRPGPDGFRAALDLKP